MQGIPEGTHCRISHNGTEYFKQIVSSAETSMPFSNLSFPSLLELLIEAPLVFADSG